MHYGRWEKTINCSSESIKCNCQFRKENGRQIGRQSEKRVKMIISVWFRWAIVAYESLCWYGAWIFNKIITSYMHLWRHAKYITNATYRTYFQLNNNFTCMTTLMHKWQIFNKSFEKNVHTHFQSITNYCCVIGDKQNATTIHNVCLIKLRSKWTHDKVLITKYVYPKIPRITNNREILTWKKKFTPALFHMNANKKLN